MSQWLSVVGIGDDGLDGLGATARALIGGAEVLIGGTRHLDMLPPDGRERLSWPSALTDWRALLDGVRGRRVCVLASGDPMEYGVGVTLARWYAWDEMIVVPAPSAFALACARLGWARADVECVTLHGRPLALLRRFLYPGARLLILSKDGETPALVAADLCAAGYEESRLTVLEHMGGAAEHRHESLARTWGAARTADLNVVAIDCVAGASALLRAGVPGLPDDAFVHDGQLTKREVRAATLAALMPMPGQRLWDVGAGCGSIAIEWMRADGRCRAVAIERVAARVRLISENATALGVPGLEIVEGGAPAALAGLPPPDAVFIGGGLRDGAILDTCWQILGQGGRLVANAVTTQSEAVLLGWQDGNGGDLRRLSVSRAEPLGGRLAWSPLRPVTQLAAIKP